MVALSHDQIVSEIPYGLICATHGGVTWNTQKRKRRWNETFTKSEQRACSRLFAKAYEWYLVKGVPDKVLMARSTYDLWFRLGEFCMAL